MEDKSALEALEQAFPQVRNRSEEQSAKREVAFALRSIRKEAGMTQGELAEKANWAQSFVSRLESPRGPLPSTETCRRYAIVCQARVEMKFMTPSGDEVIAKLVEPCELSNNDQEHLPG